MADLLIELFSEEIPARMQAKASDDLKRMMTAALKEAGLTFDGADAYATPRRLALSVMGLPTATPDISEERRGPRADAPEQAIAGFLRGAGVEREDLVEREDKKGAFLYAVIEQKGRATADVVAEALAHTIRNFPWPKSQRWGDGTLKWVRPLHSILCQFDGAVVDLDVDGFTAGDSTRGHRFMAPDEFAVTGFAGYKQKLLDHKVILDPARRQTLIRDTAQTLASAAGLELVDDAGLFTEVAGLVEWPVPMIGSFDANFLEVPEEVLQLTMKKDQKYFVTRDPATGKLANKFIFAANIEPSDDGSAVTGGNERVLAARLADAQFFYEQDLKGKLEDNLPALEDIVFHKELGTVAERVERIKKLSRYLADFIPGCDADEAERAASLCKADLVSGMVYEFPEVQGVMGRYYALEQGESAAVADAICDHYAPLGPNDECPSAPLSIAVALAEKLDTLVGFFGIGQIPTGSKDPFALRRAGLGIIRVIEENRVRANLPNILELALKLHGFEDYTAIYAVCEFLGTRLIHSFRSRGIEHYVLYAAINPGEQRDLGLMIYDQKDIVLLVFKILALNEFLDTDDGANLLAGYKRAANILKIEEKKDGKAYNQKVEGKLLASDEEKALAVALGTAQADAEAALEAEKFEAAMAVLSTLRAPIDAFFEKVKVNDDDAAVRANRLALLSSIRDAVNTVADFSLIEG